MVKKYKIGDKVIIRNDLSTAKNHIPFGVAKEMMELKGTTVTITQCNEAPELRNKNYFIDKEEDLNSYTIEEDRGRYCWHSQMFEKPKDLLIEAEAKISSLKSRLQNLSLELDKVSCELSNLIEEL